MGFSPLARAAPSAYLQQAVLVNPRVGYVSALPTVERYDKSVTVIFICYRDTSAIYTNGLLEELFENIRISLLVR